MAFDMHPLSKILTGLRTLGRMRLIALAVVGVLFIGTLGAIIAQHSSAQMALLYGNIDVNEAAEMVEDLNKAHIAAQVSPDGHSLYVPRDKLAPARLLLAKSGLPSGGVVGYELFDKNGTLTSTQFEQTINQTRALEGELERSIRLIHGVRNVRVHLVLSHRDLFSTETTPSQASVILDVGRQGAVAEDAIVAIQNLVSAAVPGLRAQGISIVDTRGELLARPADPDSLAGEENTLEKQRHAEELRLAQAVEDILTPSLGIGHVRARVAVTMNTDLIHESDESYDPNQQVLRSQSSSTDKSVNSDTTANTTVGNNLPNANAAQNNRTGSSEERTDETNNYEIGKRTRLIQQTRPRVGRISLAVVVDGTFATGPQGKTQWKPQPPEEIARLTRLVQAAIGYDKSRGDEVNVVSMPFHIEGDGDVTQEKTPFFTRDMVMYLVEWFVPVLLILGAALMVLGPILRSRRTALLEQRKASVRGSTRAASVPTDASDGVRMEGVEGEMHRAALMRASQQFESNPEEAIALVRAWLLAPDDGQNTQTS